MLSEPFADLIDILTRTRELLLLPANNFAWSSWEDAEAAVRELDGLIESLKRGQLPPRFDLRALFAATGPIQEVSLSSGWGDAFLEIAGQFDRAEQRAYAPSPSRYVAGIKRHTYIIACCRTLLWACTPRLPSRRFWIWSVSTFSVAFLCVVIGLRALGAPPVDVADMIVAALCIAFPCQMIGMSLHSWINRNRGERQGFEIVTQDDKAT